MLATTEAKQKKAAPLHANTLQLVGALAAGNVEAAADIIKNGLDLKVWGEMKAYVSQLPAIKGYESCLHAAQEMAELRIRPDGIVATPRSPLAHIGQPTKLFDSVEHKGQLTVARLLKEGKVTPEQVVDTPDGVAVKVSGAPFTEDDILHDRD